MELVLSRGNEVGKSAAVAWTKIEVLSSGSDQAIPSLHRGEFVSRLAPRYSLEVECAAHKGTE